MRRKGLKLLRQLMVWAAVLVQVHLFFVVELHHHILVIPFPESKARCAKVLGQRKQPQTTTLCAQLARLLARGLYTPRRKTPASCTFPRNEATPPHLRFTSPLSFRYLLPDETRPAPKRPHSFLPL